MHGSNAIVELPWQTHCREVLATRLIAAFQFGKPIFALLDLMAEQADLVFVPDIADASGDE